MSFHVVSTEFEIVDNEVIETKGNLEQRFLRVVLPIEGILTFRELNSKREQDILRSFTGEALGAYIQYYGSFFLIPKMKLYCFLDEALPDGTIQIQKDSYGLLIGPNYSDWFLENTDFS